MYIRIYMCIREKHQIKNEKQRRTIYSPVEVRQSRGVPESLRERVAVDLQLRDLSANGTRERTLIIQVEFFFNTLLGCRRDTQHSRVGIRGSVSLNGHKYILFMLY